MTIKAKLKEKPKMEKPSMVPDGFTKIVPCKFPETKKKDISAGMLMNNRHCNNKKSERWLGP